MFFIRFSMEFITQKSLGAIDQEWPWGPDLPLRPEYGPKEKVHFGLALK